MGAIVRVAGGAVIRVFGGAAIRVTSGTAIGVTSGTVIGVANSRGVASLSKVKLSWSCKATVIIGLISIRARLISLSVYL